MPKIQVEISCTLPCNLANDLCTWSFVAPECAIQCFSIQLSSGVPLCRCKFGSHLTHQSTAETCALFVRFVSGYEFAKRDANRSSMIQPCDCLTCQV